MSTRTGFAPLPDGGRLAFALHGDASGEPLLLVRPLGGSMALWEDFRAALLPTVRTISFDPLGVGASSETHPHTNTRAMATNAAILLEHLQVARAHVFGLSLGGMVASYLAIDHPARVARLVLASTMARGLDVSTSGALRGSSLATCMVRPARMAEGCLVRRVLSPRFRREHPDRVERYVAIAEATPASRIELLRHVAAAAKHDARGELHRIEAKTLLVYGDDDPLIGRVGRHDLEEHLPDARVVRLASAGHDLSLERPDETARCVLEHLAADRA